MRKLKWLFINFRNLPTMIAFRILKRAMAMDKGYAISWQSNIAMAIYDESRPQCICLYRYPETAEWPGHDEDCAIVRAHNARHFAEHELSSAFCDNAASRFMNLCFGVDGKS